MSEAAWDDLRARIAAMEMPVFPVRGADLIAAGFEPGPIVGVVMRQLTARWINSDFSASREDLIASIRDPGWGYYFADMPNPIPA